MGSSMQHSGVVDAQCHVSTVWYEPLETLLDQMTRYGVAQAVLIQMIGQTDNRYQQQCLARHPGSLASVVWIDPARPDSVAELDRLADEGASGVRLRPTARSGGPDPLALWRCAERRGLTVSCVGNAAGFSSPDFAGLVQELPALNVVLEHLGGASQTDTDDAMHAQRMQVMQLARYPNLHLKVPGLGELVPRRQPPPADGSPFESRTPAVLQAAVDAFGPRRLMWGSDFPPVGSREGYGNALAGCRRALAHLSSEDLGEIFGGVARRLFKLPAKGVPV